MNRREYLCAGCLAGVTAVSGCLWGDDTPDDAQLVELVEHEWYEETFGSGVAGRAENISGQELSFVEVEVTFFDEENEQLGEGSDNTSPLEEDDTWEFDVEFSGDTVSMYSYEIEVNVTEVVDSD